MLKYVHNCKNIRHKFRNFEISTCVLRAFWVRTVRPPPPLPEPSALFSPAPRLPWIAVALPHVVCSIFRGQKHAPNEDKRPLLDAVQAGPGGRRPVARSVRGDVKGRCVEQRGPAFVTGGACYRIPFTRGAYTHETYPPRMLVFCTLLSPKSPLVKNVMLLLTHYYCPRKVRVSAQVALVWTSRGEIQNDLRCSLLYNTTVVCIVSAG